MDEPGKPQTKADQPPRSALRGLGVGYVLLASVLVGLAIGWAIDQHYGTAPRWTAICSAVFIVAGLYQVVKEHWPR